MPSTIANTSLYHIQRITNMENTAQGRQLRAGNAAAGQNLTQRLSYTCVSKCGDSSLTQQLPGPCTAVGIRSAHCMCMFMILYILHLCLQARGCPQDDERKPVSDRQTHVAQVLSSQNKENVSDNVNITLAVQSLWSGMVHKLVQQDLRAKKFEEIWPNVLDDIILQGFAGAY